MTTDKYLRQIKKLNKMIVNRLNEIDRWHEMAENVSSKRFVADLVQSSGVQDRLGIIVAKIVDAESEVDRLVDMYVEKKSTIIKQIESMEYKEYVVFYGKFIDEKPIADIADELECTTRQVSRYYRSGLIDFEEKYGEFYKNVV